MAEDLTPAVQPFRHGRSVEEGELAALAAKAVRDSGRSLTNIAAQLGKSLSSVSDAVNQPQRPMTALRREIIALLTPYRVEGPVYRLIRKGKAGN
jgi:hypothetical protein